MENYFCMIKHFISETNFLKKATMKANNFTTVKITLTNNYFGKNYIKIN